MFCMEKVNERPAFMLFSSSPVMIAGYLFDPYSDLEF